MNEPQRLWTPEDVADYLKVSPLTVRRWLRSGKLPGVKVGREWRIRQSDLDAWVNELK